VRVLFDQGTPAPLRVSHFDHVVLAQPIPIPAKPRAGGLRRALTRAPALTGLADQRAYESA